MDIWILERDAWLGGLEKRTTRIDYFQVLQIIDHVHFFVVQLLAIDQNRKQIISQLFVWCEKAYLINLLIRVEILNKQITKKLGSIVMIRSNKLANHTMWLSRISAPLKSLSAKSCKTDLRPMSFILFCLRSILRFFSKYSLTNRMQFK